MEAESSSVVALERAIDVVGSQAAVARLLKVSQTAVWKWVSRKKPLPAEHVLAVEEETKRLGDCVTKEELRPDLYRGKPSSHPSSSLDQFGAAR